jgi:hypothetical protein
MRQANEALRQSAELLRRNQGFYRVLHELVVIGSRQARHSAASLHKLTAALERLDAPRPQLLQAGRAEGEVTQR